MRQLKIAGKSWHDIYIGLGELQETCSKALVKSLAQVLISYVALKNFGNTTDVGLTIEGVTVSVPTHYYTLISSYFLFFATTNLQNVAMIILLRSREGTRVRLFGFHSGMYGLFHGQDAAALTTPILLNNFLKERVGVSPILSALTLIVFLSTLIPLFAYSAYLLSWQFSLASAATATLVSKAVSLAGSAIILIAYIYVILFNIPIPFKKNKEGIRWGFLSRLYRIGPHPQLDLWQKESNK